jgi:hypothetical protein
VTVKIPERDRLLIPQRLTGAPGEVREIARRYGVAPAAIYALIDRDRKLIENIMQCPYDFRKVDGRWQRRLVKGGSWEQLTVHLPQSEPVSLRGTRPTEPRYQWTWTPI